MDSYSDDIGIEIEPEGFDYKGRATRYSWYDGITGTVGMAWSVKQCFDMIDETRKLMKDGSV